MLILIKYANQRYKFAFAIYPADTHTLLHTHTQTYTEREKSRHTYAGKAQMGDTCNPTKQCSWKVDYPWWGSPLCLALPPPWQLLCYGIISLFMQQMTNAICCLHIGPALPNGNRRRTAKNGCKDMIISNHLNNLPLAAARTESPLFRVPCARYAVKILA